MLDQRCTLLQQANSIWYDTIQRSCSDAVCIASSQCSWRPLFVWCSISWSTTSSTILQFDCESEVLLRLRKPWSWKEPTAMHLVCVMWCCGVSKLHVCHDVLAEASITNSMSAAMDRSVLRPENWDMSKQMLWRKGEHPNKDIPSWFQQALFCFDKRRLTSSTVCKNPDVSLLGRKIDWEQRPCTWSSMFEICIWKWPTVTFHNFRVSARSCPTVCSENKSKKTGASF